MKKISTLIAAVIFIVNNLNAQENTENSYWQAKIDFLEPLVNKSVVARVDYGFKRHVVGLFGGYGGNISEFDNEQFDTYQDNINFRIGIEYQYFISKN